MHSPQHYLLLVCWCCCCFRALLLLLLIIQMLITVTIERSTTGTCCRLQCSQPGCVPRRLHVADRATLTAVTSSLSVAHAIVLHLSESESSMLSVLSWSGCESTQ